MLIFDNQGFWSGSGSLNPDPFHYPDSWIPDPDPRRKSVQKLLEKSKNIKRKQFLTENNHKTDDTDPERLDPDSDSVNIRPDNNSIFNMSLHPRLVGRSVIVSYKGGKVHFHAPIEALVLNCFSELGELAPQKTLVTIGSLLRLERNRYANKEFADFYRSRAGNL